MDPVFIDAFVPRETRVLGVRLEPLSLGHIVLFYAADLPWVTGAAPTLYALSIAVWICSRPAYPPSGRLDSKAAFKQAQKWGKNCRKLDFKKEFEEFRAYFDYYSQHPETWASDGGKAPRSPWPYTIMWALKSHGQFTLAEVWNMPLSLAMANYACLGETMGVEIASEEEKRVLDQWEKEEKEAEARA